MNSAETGTIRKPFIEHVRELQVRLTLSFVAIGICGGVAYVFYEKLLELIQKPLGQTLYYTSPVGGFNFIFKLCLAAGFVGALPFVLYQLFSFVAPLLQKNHTGVIIKYVLWAFILAIAGVLFGYFISLPAALHFLTNFGGQNIQSLIRADEYFNFALAYIAGFALIFQTPLILLFTNRIKPLKPGGMMKFQRYIIVFSFVLAAVLTPTPDPVNQAIMALPIVFLYQVGVILVWLVNKYTRHSTVVPLPEAPVMKHRQPIQTLPNNFSAAQPVVRVIRRPINDIMLDNTRNKRPLATVRLQQQPVVNARAQPSTSVAGRGRLIDMVVS